MIDRLKPYPAMRESGVSWLGDVPKHWNVLPNRALFAEVKDRDHPDEEMLSVTITSGIVRQKALLARSSKKDSSNLDKSAYKLVQPHDLAYNKVRAWQGAIAVSNFRGIISPAYVVMRLRETQHARFFHYLYRTPQFAGEAERWSYDITSDMWSLRPEHFRLIYTVLPPVPEQIAIVRFLDHADGRVRRYIRAKQKLIKLLEEEKQAIIHRAVTRGVNPNVRLKPSGVKWLGEVAEHWEVRRLHQVTDSTRPIMYGIVLPGPSVAEGVYIVKGGNCEPGKLRPDKLSRTTFEIEARYARSRLIGQDIVFAIRGGVGAAELVPPKLAGANLTQDAARIAADAGVNPRWLLHAVRAPIFQEHVRSKIVGATVRGINIRDLKRVELVLPPSNEQTEIVQFIEGATTTLVTAIDRANREVSLLREYRTRLIADLVTGKMDVRDAAARLPEEAPQIEPLDELENIPEDEGAADDEELDAADAA
jgi:type I restriction enzyme, S subunit